MLKTTLILGRKAVARSDNLVKDKDVFMIANIERRRAMAFSRPKANSKPVKA